MSFVTHLRGIGSGATYPPDAIMNLCPLDGRPLEMVFDLERLRHERPSAAWLDRERRDMWRYGALLALDCDDPADRAHIVSLGEGCTPMRAWDDHPVARAAGFHLAVKDEGAPVPGFGANPTLSFKDRGMAMVVSMARRLGLKRLAVPTQGNAGDSLAEYALAAGLECVVVMPGDTPTPILGRVAALSRLHAGIQLDLVEGTIREAGARVIERYEPDGYFNVATFREPGWRIEGKKTLGLEIAEADDGTFGLPDVIVYPTGGGTGMLGMWKAFAELQALELLGPQRPRMIAVQAQATAPIVHAFAAGAPDTTPAPAGQTLATGLNVAGGVGHFRVLQIIAESGGRALAVDEDAIAAELSRAWRDKGWWVCPEGAAALAALAPLAEAGYIRAGERVVVVNTGSFEKYLPNVRHLL